MPTILSTKLPTCVRFSWAPSKRPASKDTDFSCANSMKKFKEADTGAEPPKDLKASNGVALNVKLSSSGLMADWIK